MLSWLVAPTLAALLGALAGWLRRWPRRAPGLWMDVLLGAGGAVLFTASTFLVLWHFHLVRSNLSSSDFHEYCETIARMRSRSPENWSASRPWPAYALPGVLSPWLGIIDGLVGAALVSSLVFAGALYLWGRALHSRAAGVAAAALAAALGPLTLIGRTPSFYPEVSAWFVLTSGLVALALRTRGWFTYALAAAALGVALLMDLRGLAWGLSCGLALVLGALREGWLRGGLRLAFLGWALARSYAAGPAAYGPASISLEDRGSVHRLLIEAGKAPPESQQPPPPNAGYQWGVTPLGQIPGTLRTLASDAALAPPEGFVAYRDRTDPHGRLARLVSGLSAFGLLSAALALRRRPWEAMALLLTTAPFAACTWAAFRMVSWHPRFLLLGLPGLAVLLGVGLGGLAHGRADAPSPGGRWGLLHLALVAVLSWAIPLGWLPSPMKVPSAWELPWVADDEPTDYWRRATNGGAPADRERECFAALKEDDGAGRAPTLAKRSWR